jgi:hypothetical protein
MFRSTPPTELVLRFLTGFGINSIEDTTWFSKPSDILSLEELLPELQPYYYPSKFNYFPFTQTKAITILRQILRVHGITLVAAEKTCGGIKGTWYHLPVPERPMEIELRFD